MRFSSPEFGVRSLIAANVGKILIYGGAISTTGSVPLSFFEKQLGQEILTDGSIAIALGVLSLIGGHFLVRPDDSPDPDDREEPEPVFYEISDETPIDEQWRELAA